MDFKVQDKIKPKRKQRKCPGDFCWQGDKQQFTKLYRLKKIRNESQEEEIYKVNQISL